LEQETVSDKIGRNASLAILLLVMLVNQAFLLMDDLFPVVTQMVMFGAGIGKPAVLSSKCCIHLSSEHYGEQKTFFFFLHTFSNDSSFTYLSMCFRPTENSRPTIKSLSIPNGILTKHLRWLLVVGTVPSNTGIKNKII
jgi:hypothetical protein